MAAPPLRIVRHSKRRALTAASAPVAEPSRVVRSTMAGAVGRNDWQNDAWDMFDQVGELAFYVGWRANSCSRARLVASDLDPETGEPTGSTDNVKFRQMVKALAGGRLGQAQYQKRATECLTVPGEYWSAVIHPEDGSERWLVVTTDEMHAVPGDSVEIDLPEPDAPRYKIQKPTDSLFKVWNPHPRKAKETTSTVRACLDALHEIVRTSKKIRNADNSRLVGNGIIFVPQEMSLPPVNVPTPEGQPLPLMTGTSAVQQLAERLWETANIAEDDENSMAALIPLLATVPAEFIGKVEHLQFGSDVTDTEIKKRNDAISRLAMGLDVAPERLLGMGSESNHWSAWQIADEDIQLHVAPVMETICQSIYQQMMIPVMTKEGLDPSKFILWYDTSELTADPDKGDNGEQAFAAGAITSERYREYKGLDPDAGYDFKTEDGVLAWAWDRVSAHPELLTTYAPLLPEPIPTLIAQAAAAALPPPLETVPPDQGAPQQEPQTEGNPLPDQQVPVAAAARNGRMRVL